MKLSLTGVLSQRKVLLVRGSSPVCHLWVENRHTLQVPRSPFLRPQTLPWPRAGEASDR